jgi:hypothetical protein
MSDENFEENFLQNFEILEKEISTMENVEKTKGKFRLASKKVILTYKDHIDKIDYIKWLKNKAPCSVWIAHETGDKIHNYNHSHVLIEFNKRVDWHTERCLDYNSTHPNIKKIITKNHWENCIKYMCKEDKSNLDLIDMATKLDDGCAKWIWKSDNLHDALGKCSSVQEALGVKLLWDNRPKKDFKTDYVLKHSWQLELEKELTEKPHYRKIIWYYDKIGNTGKTMMGNYLEDHKNAIVLRQLSSAKDSATIMQNILDKGWDGNIIVVDLPRQADRKSIYESLEGLKDGRMTATKYQGGCLSWPRPHLIVYANFKPDRSQLSADRLEVRDITPKIKNISRPIKINIKKKNNCPHCKLCSQCNLSLTIESSDDELSITVSSSSDSDS